MIFVRAPETFGWKQLCSHLVGIGRIIADEVPSMYDAMPYDISGSALSVNQQKIFDRITQITNLNNHHWVLGGAGTGKSFLLQVFRRSWILGGEIGTNESCSI